MLRGKDGTRFVEVDARGRVVRQAGARPDRLPEAGPTLHTNIDLDLQRFTATLFGDSLQGGAVAMDPKTGAVLALHSAPSYDPNDFIGGISSAKYQALLQRSAEAAVQQGAAGRVPAGVDVEARDRDHRAQAASSGWTTACRSRARGSYQFGNRPLPLLGEARPRQRSRWRRRSRSRATSTSTSSA